MLPRMAWWGSRIIKGLAAPTRMQLLKRKLFLNRFPELASGVGRSRK